MRALSRESRGGSEPARLRPYQEAQYGDYSGRRYGEPYEERASQGLVLLAIRSDEGDVLHQLTDVGYPYVGDYVARHEHSWPPENS